MNAASDKGATDCAGLRPALFLILSQVISGVMRPVCSIAMPVCRALQGRLCWILTVSYGVPEGVAPG